MNQISASLLRLAIISSAAFATATASNWFNHRSYWQGTIHRVQTVDFNILSHMLPTKLSYALQQENREEIQRTIDSNYGLFGLAVTNCRTAKPKCPNQQILYASSGRRDWKTKLQSVDLASNPYDILRDPPPLLTEGQYESSRATEREPTDRKNQGEIVGRVYYLRGSSPSFATDYIRWLTQPWSSSSSYRYYLLTAALFLTAGVAGWSVIEMILAKKRAQYQRAQETQEQLRKEALESKRQSEIQFRQITELLAEREQNQDQLERYREEQEQYTQRLQQELSRLELEYQSNTQELEQFQNELAKALAGQTEVYEEIQKREQAVANLKKQVDYKASEKRKTLADIGILQQTLQKSQRREVEASRQIEALKQEITSIARERNQASEKMEVLEQRLEGANQRLVATEELAAELEAAKADLDQARELSKKFEEYVAEENQQLERKNELLVRERDELQLQIWDLEEQLTSSEQQIAEYIKYLTQPSEISIPTLEVDASRSESVSLALISLALVGGHSSTRREVINELRSRYALQSYVEIPPFSETSSNLRGVRERIENYDLIVVITRFIGHDLYNIISNLESSGSLQGQVLLTNFRGKTGVIRDVLNFVERGHDESSSQYCA